MSWLEEPFGRYEAVDLARVAEMTDLPITDGENTVFPHERVTTGD